MTQTLEAGRDALARHSWEDAYQELTNADQESSLAPDDLERLADAAWWTARVDEAMDLLERAYHGYVDEGNVSRAAVMALRLGERSIRSLRGPVAQGWMTRAERLLEDAPESAAHAWYNVMRAAQALGMGDPETSIAHADRAIDLGLAHGDPDAENLARAFKGAALTRIGRIDEGLALLDESVLAATSGELGTKIACDVYCVTLAACHDVSDVQRSTEWTERADRFMRQQDATGYPGACRVHRAELKRRQGKWTEAEEEALAACGELERFRLLDVVGDAYHEIGEIRLSIHDLNGAEEAFQKAYENGRDPQPGLALLTLLRGDAPEAARLLQRSLDRLEGEVLGRFLLLPAQLEISLVLGDLDTARAAAAELEESAAEHPSPVWTATARSARGAVDLVEGNLTASIDGLDAAWRQWQELDFPYDSARARTDLGRARRAAGDETGARLELNAALSAFQRLGAVRDVRIVEGLLGVADDQSATVVTRTFMFTDIVTSTDLIGLIGDSAWADLIKWHDRTLGAAFAAHGGEVVNHTGDGFFVVFDAPGPAVECAVDIQRSLRQHRVDHGFAPSIRIGVHVSEATHGEGTFTGRGVHVAARIGEIGESDEIVLSEEAVSAAGDLRHPVSDPRTVELKGVPEPVVVRTVDWA